MPMASLPKPTYSPGVHLGSRRSLIGIAALLAALGVIAFAAIQSGAPPVGDRPEETRESGGSNPAPASRAAAAESDAHRVAIPAEDGARTPMGPDPSAKPGAPLATIRVRVIDKATREGCPRAEVLFST